MFTTSVVEFKCPIREAHYELPPRYYLQCLSTMEALDVDRMLYISWTKSLTTVYEIKRKSDFFSMVLDLAIEIYGTEKQRRPSKLHENVISIKEKNRDLPS